MIEHPREKADMVRRFARNYRKANIDFDRSGVQWLDGFIDCLRKTAPDQYDGKRIFALGSFFGVCVVETFGGRWAFADGSWKLDLHSSHEIDPYLITRLHFELGPQNSVLGVFDLIPAPVQPTDET